MSIRAILIDHSKGNDLQGFWRFYRWRQHTKYALLRSIFTYAMCRSAHRHGGYVGPGAVIESIPSLPHGLHGIYISRYAVIKKDCRIYQNVTIGEVNGQAPIIGEGCFIGAGAVLIGGITVGAHARIGAGAVVCTDVPAGATVVSQPARILTKEADAT